MCSDYIFFFLNRYHNMSNKDKEKKHNKISKKLSFNKNVLICILIHSSLINRTILTTPTP